LFLTELRESGKRGEKNRCAREEKPPFLQLKGNLLSCGKKRKKRGKMHGEDKGKRRHPTIEAVQTRRHQNPVLTKRPDHCEKSKKFPMSISHRKERESAAKSTLRQRDSRIEKEKKGDV